MADYIPFISKGFKHYDYKNDFRNQSRYLDRYQIAKITARTTINNHFGVDLSVW